MHRQCSCAALMLQSQKKILTKEKTCSDRDGERTLVIGERQGHIDRDGFAGSARLAWPAGFLRVPVAMTALEGWKCRQLMQMPALG